VHEWLEQASAKLDGARLERGEIEALLDLARVAARTSGDRRNAPLVTYLVGLARGRGDQRSVEEIAAELARDVGVT
jgi:hypothetical protein